MLEMNLFEKSKRKDFASDVPKLLPRNHGKWEVVEAFNLIKSKLINQLPGDSWKLSPR
jgi:hypothetical protein